MTSKKTQREIPVALKIDSFLGIAVFLLLAVMAKTIEFKDMSSDCEAFSGSFLFVMVVHGADINAFSLTAFSADQMMMMMSGLGQFIDIASTAINLMNDIQFSKQREIAVNGVQRYIRLCFSYAGQQLLGGREAGEIFKGIEDSPPLWGDFVSLCPQLGKTICYHATIS